MDDDIPKDLPIVGQIAPEGFSPKDVASLKTAVMDLNLPAFTLVVTSKTARAFLTLPEWEPWIDPPDRHKLSLQGTMDCLMGLEVRVTPGEEEGAWIGTVPNAASLCPAGNRWIARMVSAPNN